MATSVKQIGNTLLLVGVTLLVACEVHTTSEPLPFLEPGAGQVAATVAPGAVTRDIAIQPVLLLGADGTRREVTPLDPLRYYVDDAASLPTDPVIGVTTTAVVPVEPFVAGLRGDVIVESRLALNVVTEPVSAVAPGRRLIRVVERNGRSIREPLQAIGRTGTDLIVTCPRRAEGAVWDEDAGAWVVAVWQLADDGGCPVLRPLHLPARD